MPRYRVLLALLATSCVATEPPALLTQIGLSDHGDVTAWHQAAAARGDVTFAEEGCAVPLSSATLRRIEAAVARSAPAPLPPEQAIQMSPDRIHLASGGVMILPGGGIVIGTQGQAHHLIPADRKRLRQLINAAITPYDCNDPIALPF